MLRSQDTICWCRSQELVVDQCEGVSLDKRGRKIRIGGWPAPPVSRIRDSMAEDACQCLSGEETTSQPFASVISKAVRQTKAGAIQRCRDSKFRLNSHQQHRLNRAVCPRASRISRLASELSSGPQYGCEAVVASCCSNGAPSSSRQATPKPLISALATSRRRNRFDTGCRPSTSNCFPANKLNPSDAITNHLAGYLKCT